MKLVSATSFREATAEDWELAVAEGNRHYIASAGAAALALLQSQKDADTNGWQVNNYQHSLQCATRALRHGETEEFVICALLHDIGQDLDPFNHDKIAGAVLKSFVSEEHLWMVSNHQIFQLHFRTHSKFDTTACEKYRGHPAFEKTMHFCENYDQNCFDPHYQHLPLESFEPMVRRVFGRVIEERIGRRYTAPIAAE